MLHLGHPWGRRRRRHEALIQLRCLLQEAEGACFMAVHDLQAPEESAAEALDHVSAAVLRIDDALELLKPQMRLKRS